MKLALPGRLFAFTITIVLALPATLAAEPVVIARSVIYPGQEITADMLKRIDVQGKVKSRKPFVTEVRALTGKLAARTILPKRLIYMSYVRDPDLVSAGDPVRVIYNAGGLRITMVGIPLVDGMRGDVIRVRNKESGRVFTGVVRENGMIEVEEF